MFGKIVSEQAPGLPSISIFILFGLCCGPFGLGMVSRLEMSNLSWLSHVALGFIGLSAGGEPSPHHHLESPVRIRFPFLPILLPPQMVCHFHVSEMAGNLRSVIVILFFLVCLTFAGMISAMFLFGDYFIPFYTALKPKQKISASALIACLSVARSPSSAIAIISEMNAKGPFTTIVLAVTVCMDIVVVVLFSSTQLVAEALEAEYGGVHSNRSPLIVLLNFVLQTLVSVLAGIALGHLLPFVVGWIFRKKPIVSSAGWGPLLMSALVFYIKALLTLLQRVALTMTGWLLFFDEKTEEEMGRSPWQNPLIVCMVAGFTMVNFTNAGAGFERVVNDISGPMYLAFFVYTGAGMDVQARPSASLLLRLHVLDHGTASKMLFRNLGAVSMIFAVRCVLIVLSTYVGGKLAGSHPEVCSRYWMTFLTQAGVTLGLAAEASSHFQWGPDFAATIVGVVVCNQAGQAPHLTTSPSDLPSMALSMAVGEEHHNYLPELSTESTIGMGSLGKSTVPITYMPQPRGALVVGRMGSDADVVTRRLRASKWEILHCDDEFAIFPSPEEKARLEKQSIAQIALLPRKLREEVDNFALAPKPWERLAAHTRRTPLAYPPPPAARSTRLLASPTPYLHLTSPSLRSAPDVRSMRGQQQQDASAEGGVRKRIMRSKSFGRKTRGPPLSVAELLSPPSAPEMPEGAADEPHRYSACMRLLMLASCMKSLDVVLLMMPSDEENLRLNRVVNEMRHLLRYVTGNFTESDVSGRPQVVILVSNESRAQLSSPREQEFIHQAAEKEHPPPLIIPRRASLPGLVCEVLHPAAHWSGSVERSGREEEAKGNSTLEGLRKHLIRKFSGDSLKAAKAEAMD
ncbi:MAG: hypothetical protein SGPRY_004953 [Prymnesium sp.]